MAVAVGEGELLGLDGEVDPIGPQGREGREVEAFEEVELREEQEALRDGGRLVHGDAAVVRRDRRDDLGLLAGEVLGGKQRALPAQERDHALGELAPVEGVGAALGDDPQALAQVGRRPPLARRGRPAVRQELPRRQRVAGQQLGPFGEPAADVLGDHHPVLGEPDRRGPQLGPGTRAVPLPDRLVDRDRPRHADGVDPVQRHRAEAPARVVLRGGAGGGDAAPVEGDQLAAPRVVEDDEGVAPEAAHHREHHALGGRHRDGGVEGVASRLEDGRPHEGGHRVGRGDHAAEPEGLGLPLGPPLAGGGQAPGAVVDPGSSHDGTG